MGARRLPSVRHGGDAVKSVFRRRPSLTRIDRAGGDVGRVRDGAKGEGGTALPIEGSWVIVASFCVKAIAEI